MTELKGFVHTRIDARLIHGQVAGIWSGYLNINRIMVIDDEVAIDDTQKSLLRMVAPSGVATSILTKEVALENIKAEKYASQRVLLLVKSPDYLKFLLDNGVHLKSFNVGNMSTRDTTRRITPSINITPDEEKIFRELVKQGVEVTVQMVPNDTKKLLIDLM